MASTETESRNGLAFSLLSERGFSVIPLRPRGKKPQPGFQWSQFQKTPPTEDQFNGWLEQKRFDDCNWGVVCGAVSGLVVADCDSRDAVQWARDHLPRTPWTVKTGRGWHLYYKYPFSRPGWLAGVDRERIKQEHRLDLQADGRYVVAPGSVHESGAVYEPHFDGPWDYVPEFDIREGEGGAENMADALADLDLSHVRGTHDPVGEGFRHDLILSRVGSLINDGLTPSQVLREARKLNKELCDPPLSDKEIFHIVNSTFSSDVRNKKAKSEPVRPSTDPETEANLEIDDSDPVTDAAWPDELLHPGGVLEKIMDYTEKAAVRTERVYALAGSLVTMGTILGQRVVTETNLVTNLYCMAVGDSASGKDAPKRSTIRLLEAIDPNLFAGSDVSSEVAIYAYLRDWHRACFVFDEIGMLLKGAKRPGSPKNLIVMALTSLLSGDNRSKVKKTYTLKEMAINFDWYAISLLGLSVPEEYYGAMQTGEETNGWLARNLVFEARGPLREKRYDVDADIPEGLLEDLRALWAIPTGEGGVETGRDGSVSTTPAPPKPHVVRMTDAALALHKSLDRKIEARARDDADLGVKGTSILFRSGETAMKIALLHLFSRLGPAAIHANVEEEDVRWAWLLVETEGVRRVARVKEAIFESDFDAVMQKVRETIQRYRRREKSKTGNYEKPGAPEAYIYRNVRGVPTDVLKKAVDHMIKANELRVRLWKASEKSKRILTLYCLVREKEEV